LSTASSAVISPAERSIATATRCSGPIPRAISARASRFAEAFSQPYVTTAFPQVTATASGLWAAHAWNRSGNVAAGSGRAVSFHPVTICRRAAALRISIRFSGVAGACSSAATRPVTAVSISSHTSLALAGATASIITANPLPVLSTDAVSG
jgi:hypothetical protein